MMKYKHCNFNHKLYILKKYLRNIHYCNFINKHYSPKHINLSIKCNLTLLLNITCKEVNRLYRCRYYLQIPPLDIKPHMQYRINKELVTNNLNSFMNLVLNKLSNQMNKQHMCLWIGLHRFQPDKHLRKCY